MPKPIAYIVSRFPRLTETFVLREISELKQRGQPVLVFPLLSVQQSIHHTEAAYLAENVYYTPYMSREVFAANWQYMVRLPDRYLKSLFRVVWENRDSWYLWIRGAALFPKSVYIARLIAESNVQHLHAHFATHPALAAMIISELTGIGYSFTAHAHDIFVHKAMLKMKIKLAQFVVTISEYNRHHLLRLAPGIPETKIHVVRCGVDPTKYILKDPRCSEAKDRCLRILCVASLEPYKGVENLIRACARLRKSVPTFCCTIIGDGRNRKSLSNLISGLKLEQQVHLIGPRKQDEVAEQLKQTDIFVLPSVVARNGQMEGIPVALMEAMASGIPVVASQLSGIPELVEHGVNGLLVPPGDATALFNALEFLYHREDLWERLGQRGREKITAMFNLSDNVTKLRSLFIASAAKDSTSGCEKASLSHELVEEIRQIVFQGADKHDMGKTHISLQPLHAAAGHDSAVYEVRVDGIQQAFILKQHQPREVTAHAEHCAQREHGILKHLARELLRYSSRFRVPQVLAFFPESHSLLLEACPGETFERQLRWARLGYGRCGTAMILRGASACGEWLGAFHTIACQQEKAFAEIQGEIKQAFECDLQACARLGLENKIVSRASKHFSAQFQAAVTAAPELTSHHGDFGPHNIFLAPDRITAIDFEGFRTGFPGEDLADFLVLLNLLPFYHADVSLRRSLRRAFLEGYVRQRPLEIKPISIFEIQALVKRMAHNPGLRLPATAHFAWKRERLFHAFHRCFQSLLP